METIYDPVCRHLVCELKEEALGYVLSFWSR
jgi:hypothetical protein